MNSFSSVPAKSPAIDNTRAFENFFRSLSPGQGILLLVLLGSIALLALFHNPGKSSRKRLASGRFGGRAEKAAAARTARRQMKGGKKNEVAVRLGESSLYFPDAQRGIAVIGAPGTGKTVSAIDPIALSVIDQGFPAILYDFKYPAQTSRLLPHALDRGYDIHIFAPGFPESEVCNPLDFLEDASDSLMARQLAEIFNRNFKRAGSGQTASEDGFFGPAGDQAAEAFLLLAKDTPFPDLIMCQSLLSLPDVVGRVQENQEKLNPWCMKSFGQLISSAKSERTLSSILATTNINFTRFLKREILPSVCGKTTLPLWIEGKKLIVLGLERERRDVVSPLIAAILHLLINRNVARKRSEPLFLLADELPSLYLPSLTNWLNENREDGLCTVLGFQNLAQLERIYGKDSAREILGGCSTKVIFNPQDSESARLFSEYLGQEEIRLKQESRAIGAGKANRSVSEQIQTKQLLEASSLLQLPRGRCIIINPHYKRGSTAYIPIVESIKLDRKYRKLLLQVSQRWQEIHPDLSGKRASQEITDEDLKARSICAEKMLPDRPKKRDEEGWRSLL